MRMVVVFPAPLGPRRPNTSPGFMEKVRALTASISSKLLETSSTRTIGLIHSPLHMMRANTTPSSNRITMGIASTN